jgi:hypothetical protein
MPWLAVLATGFLFEALLLENGNENSRCTPKAVGSKPRSSISRWRRHEFRPNGIDDPFPQDPVDFGAGSGID